MSNLPDPETFAPLSPRHSSSSPTADPSDTSAAPWVRQTPRSSNPSSSSARRLRNPDPYSIRRTTSGRTTASSLIASPNDPRVIFGKALQAANKFLTHTGRAFFALSVPQRVVVVIVALLIAATSAAFLAYSHKIFVWLRPAAETWRNLPFGWLIIFFASVATAFPPLFGYSTVIAISGFLYGFPGGWPVVAAANVVGSTLSLILCRTVFADYTHRLVGEDKRFVALGQVLRRDGLGMLTMIRICPLPYSLSNGFLAQVPSIKPLAFAIATGLSSPKLMVHVFIGSRLALLADEGDKMSASDKAVNYLSMVIGGIVGLTVGWLVYRRTMRRAAELALESQGEEGEEAADLLREAGVVDTEEEDERWDDWEGNDGDEEETDLESGNGRSRQGRKGLSGRGRRDEAFGVEDDDISLWDTTTVGGNGDERDQDGSYRDDSTDEVYLMNGGSVK